MSRKLTAEDVRTIRRIDAINKAQGGRGGHVALAARFGVTPMHICRIVKRKRRDDVQDAERISQHSDRLAARAQKAAMRDAAAALGPTLRAIADRHGVTPRTIARIAEMWA